MVTPGRAKAFIESAGAQVRRHRLLNALTQEQLAEMCAFSPRYIQRIEAGRVDMPISTAVHLCEQLSIDFPVALFMPARRETKPGRPKKKSRPTRS